MSMRDEIARALCRADVEPRRFCPHWNVHEWDEISDEARAYWYRLAVALMPLVERAVRDAIDETQMDAILEGFDAHDKDAIVARVTGKGEL